MQRQTKLYLGKRNNILIKLVILLIRFTDLVFFGFSVSKNNCPKTAIFYKRTFSKSIFAGAKVVNKSGCKVLRRPNKKQGRGRGLMKRRGIWCKPFIFQKKKNLKIEKKKIKI